MEELSRKALEDGRDGAVDPVAEAARDEEVAEQDEHGDGAEGEAVHHVPDREHGGNPCAVREELEDDEPERPIAAPSVAPAPP